MGALKKLLMVVGVVIVLFVATSFFIPKIYSVEEQFIIVPRPPEIYPMALDCKDGRKWAKSKRRGAGKDVNSRGPRNL